MKLKAYKIDLIIPIEINSNFIICSDSEYIHSNLLSRPLLTDDIAITQISAIKINIKDGTYEEFNELIDPGIWDDIYWEKYTEITNKTKDNHKGKPDFITVFKKYLDFIDNNQVVIMDRDQLIYEKILGYKLNQTFFRLKPYIPFDCSSGELYKHLNFEVSSNTNTHDGLFDSLNIGTVIYSIINK